MSIINKERIEAYRVDEGFLMEYLQKSFNIIDRNMEVFKDSFPHVSVGNKYKKQPNTQWTASFFSGMTNLAYWATKDEKFLRNADTYLKSFEERLEKGIGVDTHDIGFLYTLSCVAVYKLTGNEKAKEIAIKAADKLITRYNPRGEYIQAWRQMGVGVGEVKIIIDCMMNLPLLYWASKVTGDSKYADIAKKHAYTSSKTLVREDGSVYHTYLFDPISGRAIEGKTHQGKYDESTWARGQAWCVYGYTLSYILTKDAYFLRVATKAADYFINNLPENFVHYWDFAVTDVNPEVRDTSANTIGACGLLELAKYVSDEQKAIYEKTAKIMLQQLCKEYFIDTNETGYGFIRESFYNIRDCNECSSWGDYYFVEALCKIHNKEKDILF